MQVIELKKFLDDIEDCGEVYIVDAGQNYTFDILELNTCEDVSSEDYYNYSDIVIDLTDIKKPLQEEQKQRNKKIKDILKSLNNEIEKASNFQYCKNGNEIYLNDKIESLLTSKINYLKSLKDVLMTI
nr:MAG TPA: hypothetical protein [Caudoviricetes sp.]